MDNVRCPKCSSSNVHLCYISPDEDMYECRDCKIKFIDRSPAIHEEKPYQSLLTAKKIIAFLFGAAFTAFLYFLMKFLGAN